MNLADAAAAASRDKAQPFTARVAYRSNCHVSYATQNLAGQPFRNGRGVRKPDVWINIFMMGFKSARAGHADMMAKYEFPHEYRHAYDNAFCGRADIVHNLNVW